MFDAVSLTGRFVVSAVQTFEAELYDMVLSADIFLSMQFLMA